ncbi:hypothetical protein C8Q80DRAFT_1144722 [Daedaleopsis nitida]|nr:hypothetical protein C8Q80DRAFT_1144722 [Daedaleopsis nitida]
MEGVEGIERSQSETIEITMGEVGDGSKSESSKPPSQKHKRDCDEAGSVLDRVGEPFPPSVDNILRRTGQTDANMHPGLHRHVPFTSPQVHGRRSTCSPHCRGQQGPCSHFQVPPRDHHLPSGHGYNGACSCYTALPKSFSNIYTKAKGATYRSVDEPAPAVRRQSCNEILAAAEIASRKSSAAATEICGESSRMRSTVLNAKVNEKGKANEKGKGKMKSRSWRSKSSVYDPSDRYVVSEEVGIRTIVNESVRCCKRYVVDAPHSSPLPYYPHPGRS